MYWAYGLRRGGHNSQGVAAPSSEWYLAEGTVGFFDTFVLITNSSATPAEGRGDVPARGRRADHGAVHDSGQRPQDDLRQQRLPADPDAVLDGRPPDQRARLDRRRAGDVLERVRGRPREHRGHRAEHRRGSSRRARPAATPASTSRRICCSRTRNSAPADVTIDFFRDAGGPVQLPDGRAAERAQDALSRRPPRSPISVKELANASFSIKRHEHHVRCSPSDRSTGPRPASRSSTDTTRPASTPRRASGRSPKAAKGASPTRARSRTTRISCSRTPQRQPLRVKGTFMREDGLGIVHYVHGEPDEPLHAARQPVPRAEQPALLGVLRGGRRERRADHADLRRRARDVLGPRLFRRTRLDRHAVDRHRDDRGAADRRSDADHHQRLHRRTDRSPAARAVTITGTNFLETTVVEFGDRPATAIQRVERDADDRHGARGRGARAGLGARSSNTGQAGRHAAPTPSPTTPSRPTSRPTSRSPSATA